MVSNAEFGLVYGAGVNLYPGKSCSHVFCEKTPTQEGWIASKKSKIRHDVRYCAYHAIRMRKHWEKFMPDIGWELHDIDAPVVEEEWE